MDEKESASDGRSTNFYPVTGRKKENQS
jgi:hypothetical protein